MKVINDSVNEKHRAEREPYRKPKGMLYICLGHLDTNTDHRYAMLDALPTHILMTARAYWNINA